MNITNSQQLFDLYKANKLSVEMTSIINDQLVQSELSHYIDISIENKENLQDCFNDILLQTCKDLMNDDNFIDYISNIDSITE